VPRQGMARKPRMEVEPGVHHVWARGNRRQTIFLADADRHIYLGLLGRCVDRMDWSLLAYCLMGNHVHMLVETRRPNLAAGMQRLHGHYAGDFNRRHRQSGHLFQGRYETNSIEDDEQLLSTLGYIAANPVYAGLCNTAEEWRWSSHGALSRGAAPAWLDQPAVYRYLEASGGDPHDRYLELIETRSNLKRV
jgi:REP-associated tyrosine transposase